MGSLSVKRYLHEVNGPVGVWGSTCPFDRVPIKEVQRT